MIVMSDELIEFSDMWISLSFLVWLALAGVLSAMVGKGQRLVAAGDASGRDLLAKAGPIVVVLLLAMLYLMIFKRSEEHTSELQSLMRSSYAVFCLKKKTHTTD